MAKEFYTSGIGSVQTLNPSDESKIKIYDDKAAAQADISNIEENEIIATKAGESEGVDVDVFQLADLSTWNKINIADYFTLRSDMSGISGEIYWKGNFAFINLEGLRSTTESAGGEIQIADANPDIPIKPLGNNNYAFPMYTRNPNSSNLLRALYYSSSIPIRFTAYTNVALSSDEPIFATGFFLVEPNV